MKKPSIFYFRPLNFLNDVKHMSMAARGALVTLVAEMHARWQPERDPWPCLPDDEGLLASLCGTAKNWKRVRVQVLEKLTRQDGKLFSPWLNAEMGLLKQNAEHKEKKQAKKEKPAAPAVPGTARPDAAELEEAAIKGTKPEAARPWDEPPAPAERGVVVYGLQGFRAVGWQEMAALLKHPTKLKESDCIMWHVSDSGVKEMKGKVRKTAKGCELALDNGQTLTAAS